MFKSLGKGETQISCDVMFRFFCYSVFYSNEDYWELNTAKPKVPVFMIAENWGGCPLQTRYLVKKIYFYILCSSYTSCIFHIGSGLVVS